MSQDKELIHRVIMLSPEFMTKHITRQIIELVRDSEWVSVEDELPDSPMPVMVYMADRGSMMLTHYLDDFALARTSTIDGFSDHGVTHWKYLSPPTNKGGE